MAGPERVREWAGAGRVGKARSPYRSDTDDTASGGPDSTIARIAWAGRTSTYDQQDPTLSLPR